MYSAPPGVFYMRKLAVGRAAPKGVDLAAPIGGNLEGDGGELDRRYRVDDLVTTNNVSFAATGITTGELLKGVDYARNGARTHSVMMRGKSGTVRYIEAFHRWKRE